MPVGDVTSADVIETLQRLWHVRPQTARRLRQRIHAVMEWAVAVELRTDNPCDRIGPVLGRQQASVHHMRALPHAKVAAAIATVWASGATPAVKLAFEFLVLTATRSGEVRGAHWAEMDLTGRVWTIPAMRMKAKREHRVPLCQRAMEMLDAARTLGDGGDGRLVYPQPGREADLRDATAQVAPEPQDRGRATRVPIELQGLGRRADESPARGRRGGARARGAEPGRGRLRAL